MKRLTLFAFAVMLLAGCTPIDIFPVEITLNHHELTLERGTSSILSVSFSPENTTNKSFVWSSSDPDVALVSDGVVVGTGSGCAEIIVEASNGLTDKCTVTVVVSVGNIGFDYSSINVYCGEVAELKVNVLPTDTTDPVSWASSDDSIVSVDDNGTIRALKDGKVTITASCGILTASCEVVSCDPLSFEGCEDGKIAIENPLKRTISYIINDGDLKSSSLSTVTIDYLAGDTVRLFGDTDTYASSFGIFTNIKCSSTCYIYGDVMSLLDGGKQEKQLSLSKPYVFLGLFFGNTKLVNHPEKEFIISAQGLTKHCYYMMFKLCTGLTSAPKLPATSLGVACYAEMFQGCTGLIEAPSLPASTLADYCYASMFSNCSSLTRAPVIPATKMKPYCYNHMFYGCTSLTVAPELPATTLANNCYQGMFFGCNSLTKAPKLPATQMCSECYRGMFGNCSALTESPKLLARNLAEACYAVMFAGCRLSKAPDLPATTLSVSCYEYMFSYCEELTAAPALPAETLTARCYLSMFEGCSKLNYIHAMFTSIADNSCTSSWVHGVAESGTFIKNRFATWSVTGDSGIPSGWTVEYK